MFGNISLRFTCEVTCFDGKKMLVNEQVFLLRIHITQTVKGVGFRIHITQTVNGVGF